MLMPKSYFHDHLLSLMKTEWMFLGKTQMNGAALGVAALLTGQQLILNILNMNRNITNKIWPVSGLITRLRNMAEVYISPILWKTLTNAKILHVVLFVPVCVFVHT